MPEEYDVIGPWTEVKLEILRQYAAPYSRILTRQGFYHHYIDGFAGPGLHVSRTTGEPVDGSPLNALRTEPPFREFHFIDADLARVGQLREYANKVSNVHVYHGDCTDTLLKRVFPKVRYEQRHRALCLLDPYNIDLSWEVVAAAGKSKAIEIFLNFMVMDMNMNVLLRDPEKADPQQVARMNRFWGDTTWRNAAYQANPQTNFFDEHELIKADDANEKVAGAYGNRLLQLAGFDYVPKPLALKNKLGKTIYYLIFASPNKTGQKIVEHILNTHRT